MLFETIVIQSAGSLSVALLALLMSFIQILFYFPDRQFTWYAWSAAISFSAMMYSIAIFVEYNTPPGPLDRFSGILELNAIICLIHCLYGFSFSYLHIKNKRYHIVGGIIHGCILILMWSTNYIVSDSFVSRNLIGLKSPYTEPGLGFLGSAFIFYAAMESLYGMTIWIRHKETDLKYRLVFLAGVGFWILLGIHDGLVALGLSRSQYVMEYGFLGFSLAVLWMVFNSCFEISVEEKYQKEIQKKLGIAYTRMREWKDRLNAQIQGEEAVFLIDKNGQVLGITEKVLTVTNMSTIELLSCNITDLTSREYEPGLKKAIRDSWAGIFTQTALIIKGRQEEGQEFNARFMKISKKSEKWIIILLNESDLENNVKKVRLAY